MLPKDQTKGYKLFALSMTTFAISDAFGSIVLSSGFSGAFVNFIRYSILALLLFIFILVKSQLKDVFNSNYMRIILLRGFFQGFGTVLYFSAMKLIPLSMASSIFFCAPITLLAVSPFILNERVGIRQWFTVLLGFVGVFCIINPFSINYTSLFTDTTFLGCVLALIGMLSFMCQQITTKKIAGKVSLVKILFWGNTVSTIISLVGTMLFSLFPESYELKNFALLLIMSILALAAQLFNVLPYRYVRASDLAPLNYLQLAVTIFIGIVFFAERPPLLAIMGMLLIVTSGTMQGIFAKNNVQ